VVESFVVLAVDFVLAGVLLGDVGDGEDGGLAVNVVGKVVIFVDVFAVLGPADFWFGVSADGGGKADGVSDFDGCVGWSFFDLGGNFDDDFSGVEGFSELVVGLAGVGTDITDIAVDDDKGDKVGIFKDNLVLSSLLDWLSVLEPGNGWVRESLYSSADLGSRAIYERDILKSLTKESWWTVSSQLLTDLVTTEAFLHHGGRRNDVWVFKINSEFLWHDYGL